MTDRESLRNKPIFPRQDAALNPKLVTSHVENLEVIPESVAPFAPKGNDVIGVKINIIHPCGAEKLGNVKLALAALIQKETGLNPHHGANVDAIQNAVADMPKEVGVDPALPRLYLRRENIGIVDQINEKIASMKAEGENRAIG